MSEPEEQFEEQQRPDDPNDRQGAAGGSHQTAGPPLRDLETLESEIREILESLAARSQAAVQKANELIQGARPIKQCRENLRAIIDDQNARIRAAARAASEAARHTAGEVQTHVGQVERDVALRHTVVNARSDRSARLRQLYVQPAETWFDVVDDQHTRRSAQLEEIRGWVEAGQNRWQSSTEGEQ